VTASRPDVPLPEYEVEQYFPRPVAVTAEERARLRERYGYVRTAFKTSPERHRQLQQWLNQSRSGTTYDVYLTRSVRYAAVATFVGALFGLGLVLVLDAVGLLAAFRSPVRVDTGLGLDGAVAFVRANRLLVGGLVATFVLAVAAGGGTYVYRYYAPRTRASLRGRAIDVTLPHAIVYMYAQSHGGMNFIEVVRSLADSGDYGAVADEFDAILRDMDLFGADLFTALRNARNLTPSLNLEQFLDDLLSVLDSGGDVTAFLNGEAKTYLEEASEEQEDFVETLSMLSELFVAAFVAAPLFLIVTLMVIGFLGGDVLSPLYALNYLVFPLGMAAFLLLVDLLSQPFTSSDDEVEMDASAWADLRNALVDVVVQFRRAVRRAVDDRWGESLPFGPAVSTDGGVHAGLGDRRFEAYRRRKAVDALERLLTDPVTLVRRQPTLSLVVTVPLAVLVVAAEVGLGLVDPTFTALLADPVRTTVALFVVPYAVVALPLAAFHEARRHRNLGIEKRFPDALNLISSANQMGIGLTDSLEMVARWSSGGLSEEIRKLRNDVEWNHDVSAALDAFARRLAVPQLARVIRMVARSGRSSGDLSRVLSIAAEDTRNRVKLDRSRSRAMSTYIAIVVIGYLVYLFVIVMLSTAYLAPLEALAANDTGRLPTNLGAIPIDNYRVVLFHSAILQGIGSGILAGKLADNSALSGLKYSLALCALAIVAFMVI
jgi:flagellar protein FlaJ